jgi:hypothetical protein
MQAVHDAFIQEAASHRLALRSEEVVPLDCDVGIADQARSYEVSCWASPNTPRPGCHVATLLPRCHSVDDGDMKGAGVSHGAHGILLACRAASG